MSTTGSPLSIAYLAIGDELLDGRVTDTNAGTLAQFLALRSARLGEAAIARDDIEGLTERIRDLAGRHDVVITSGGLGPTTDDRTREAVARAAGCELAHRPEVLARIQRRFDAMGREMAAQNERQAVLPSTATVVPSHVGTADPFRVAVADSVVACLPGVPREFAALLEPVLGDVIPDEDAVQLATLRTIGLGESSVASRIEPLLAPHEAQGLEVSYLAAYPTITVRLRGSASALAAVVQPVREALAPWLLPDDASTPEQALIGLARARGVTLAAAESCTGGGVLERWTRVPGSSAAVRGGAVTYATDTKVSVLGVPREVVEAHSVYSVEVAARMARGARATFAADLGVATTGVAGPAGPDEGPEVGTVFVAVASDARTVVAHACFGARGRAHVRASAVALATTLALRELEGATHTIERFAGVSCLTALPA